MRNINKLKLERCLFKIGIFLISISTIMFLICLYDSKTSIYTDDWEIEKTCHMVDGLGDKSADLIKQLAFTEFENFREVKNEFRWIDFKLVDKYFKYRSDLMRYELYKQMLIISSTMFVLGSIFVEICFKYNKARKDKFFNLLKETTSKMSK